MKEKLAVIRCLLAGVPGQNRSIARRLAAQLLTDTVADSAAEYLDQPTMRHPPLPRQGIASGAL